MKRTIQRLKDFMNESGKSQNQIAKELGLSGATISQFLDGSYKGDNGRIATDIENYLALAFERNLSTDKTVFNVNLMNTKKVLFACRYAHKSNDIALVSGAAGAGKTTALRYYRDNNPGTLYIEATPCMTSTKSILRAIGKSIGKNIITNADEFLEEICKSLRGSNRLIIMDEADHLPFKALQLLRSINDRAGVGIILSGNDRIYTQMTTGQKSYELEQLKTRIIVKSKVSNEYTAEELTVIFPLLDSRAVLVMAVIAENESLRSARKIYNIACELLEEGKGKITTGLLMTAQRNILGTVYK